MKLDPTNQPFLPLPQNDDATDDTAANFIRHKLDALYAAEPDAVTETIESVHLSPAKRSKHQAYMMELATSGKPFAQVQTEWHEYYNSLPNNEKHEVWQEFYAAQGQQAAVATNTPPTQAAPTPARETFTGSFDPLPPTLKKKPLKFGPQTVGDIKSQIIGRVQKRSKLSRKGHLQSLGFGLGMGAIVVFILLFSFFNERIIAPFITPSRNVSSTPLILDPTSAAVGTEPKVIIPKINVEVPVVYDVKTIEESAIQKGLERGVVHYATTPNPGEQGNATIFGHSSNNILNRGKYKFAFVLLSRMEEGDTFYIEKDGVRYVYKVFDTKVISPTDVSILDNIPGRTSTVTLITCDPPGTTINRLAVIGEQISPDPVKNIASTAVQTDAKTETLAGNPESLWSRIWGGIF